MHTGIRNGLRRAAFAALAGAALAVCSAQDTVVQLDPAKTQVGFTLGDVLHTVHGEFKLRQGTIRFDPASGAASGAIIIDAASGNSGSNARDSRMHKNILESKKYPDITFTPRHVQGHFEPEGESQVNVEGTFNIHGADHPMTLAIKAKAAGGAVNVDTHFVVPYVAWGMKNPSTFILRVSDKVDIDVHAAGRMQAPATASRTQL